MPTAEKERTIEQARQWYSDATGVVFADYRGLSVKELQNLRRDLRSKGAEIHVIKNTLFRIAVGEEHTSALPFEHHNGTTAFAFVYKNEPEVAKALVDFARTSKKLVVKGGLFNGKALSGKEVQSLSELPPRDILISQVIGAIAAPLTTLVGTIEALYADPIRVIGAVADKVGEGSEAPAASAPSPSSMEIDEPATPVAEEPAEAAPEAATEPEAAESTESQAEQTENA